MQGDLDIFLKVKVPPYKKPIREKRSLLYFDQLSSSSSDALLETDADEARWAEAGVSHSLILGMPMGAAELVAEPNLASFLFLLFLLFFFSFLLLLLFPLSSSSPSTSTSSLLLLLEKAAVMSQLRLLISLP